MAKHKPATPAECIAALMAAKLTLREIVEGVDRYGSTVSIGHLSRVKSGERECSDTLHRALIALRAEVGK